MARKEKKYHFIYKTTNLLTGRYYIGMHSTDNLEDGYLGSGKRLRHSVNKYGKENHKREILEFFDSREELAKRETEIVNLNEILKENCINLKVCGHGGGKIWSSEHQKILTITGNQAFKNKLLTDSNFRNSFSLKCKENTEKAISEGKINFWKIGLRYDWTNKSHSDITKLKIGNSNKIAQLGEKNSQFGTIWVTKKFVNKKIKPSELVDYESDGWVRGKFTNINGELVKNSKLCENDVKIIKELLKTKITQAEIAKQFNIKQETISKIKRGLIWSNI